jgi:drug/metabolite transporter (DMT)-like permease
MTWFWFALSAAVFASLASILEKKVLKDVHSFDFSVLMALYASLFSLPLAAINPWDSLTLPVIATLAGVAVLVAIGHHAITKGLRHLEVSVASPILLLSPLVTTLLAFVFLHETVNPIQLSGIGLLMLGLYILEVHSLANWQEFIGSFTKSPHTRHILLGVVIYGCTALIDRVLLSTYHVPPELYVSVVQLMLAPIFLVWAFHRKDAIVSLRNTAAKHWHMIALIAAITTLFRTLQSEAIAIASVGVVIAVKRSSALFTTVAAGELFHETDLLRKSIACSIMVGGVCLLALG